MKRALVACLAAVLALPVASVEAPFRISVALADDDDDFRIPRFRVPTVPRIPAFKPPRMPRPPRQAPPQSRPQAPAPAPVVEAPSSRPGELIVGTIDAATLAQIAAQGFSVVVSAPSAVTDGVVARIRPPAGVGLDAARALIEQIAPAATVDLNHLYRPVEMPCRAGDCPAFDMVAWTAPPDRCVTRATIGMVDTAVNPEHEALRKQDVEIVALTAEGDRASSAMHGTAIAALLVGDEASRTPGLLPEARLIAVDAFHRDSAGDAADTFAIVRAIDVLSERGIRVVNLSFAGPPNTLLERAIEAAIAQDMVLVAAAGNRGPAADPLFPAAYDGVIAVTAVDKLGNVYRQAGQGPHIAFAAPGVNLWTAASISGGRYRSGTSYAVPFVSAAYAAALATEANTSVTSLGDVLRERTQDLGNTGRDPVFGWGLIKALPCPSRS
jgi:hypothetical protein